VTRAEAIRGAVCWVWQAKMPPLRLSLVNVRETHSRSTAGESVRDIALTTNTPMKSADYLPIARERTWLYLAAAGGRDWHAGTFDNFRDYNFRGHQTGADVTIRCPRAAPATDHQGNFDMPAEWRAAFDAAPFDPVQLLIFADYLQERGRAEEAFFRALAAEVAANPWPEPAGVLPDGTVVYRDPAGGLLLPG